MSKETHKERKYRHIDYKIEVGSDFDIGIYFMGFITAFDGEQIIATRSSERYPDRQGARKWIAEKLKELEITGEI